MIDVLDYELFFEEGNNVDIEDIFLLEVFNYENGVVGFLNISILCFFFFKIKY